MNKEEELTKRASEGDPDAFGQLYEEHRKKIQAYFSGRLSNDGIIDPDDLTSETFTKAWKAMSQGKYSPKQPVDHYLYVIAHNTLANYRRDSNREKTAPLPDEERENSSSRYHFSPNNSFSPPEDQVVKDERDSILHQQLAVLERGDKASQRYHEVISLHYLEELPNQETAVIMATTETAVKLLNFRGLNRLRQLLEKKL